MTTSRPRLPPGARVDVHTHVVPPLPPAPGAAFPVFEEDGTAGRLSVAGRVVRTVPPEAWSMDRRILELDRRGIDHHVLSPLPSLVALAGTAQEAGPWTDRLNESIAELVAPHRDRFSGMGAVAQAHPELMAGQVERAHEAGLVGVLIGTDLGGRELDHPGLGDFFEAVERLGMLVFVHPIATTLDDAVGERITGAEMRFGLGMTTETAIAASKLVFGGVLERHPRLRVVLAHGGGAFFWALSRARRLMSPGDLEALQRRLSQVYVDSVLYDVRNLRYVLDIAGGSHVLFGTDYPLPAEDVTTLERLDELAPDEAAAVRGGNARALLGC
ncbi:amidohydrolase family protein [Dactylosporangium sp. NPDC048998]|uniref:amidohydrolase family protein n=1 Tax=Dactylosporangium sp. NPDC048998 TaxID=3363976 RepID=UPI0037165D51